MLPRGYVSIPKGHVDLLYNYVNPPNDYVSYLRCNEGQHRFIKAYIGLEQYKFIYGLCRIPKCYLPIYL